MDCETKSEWLRARLNRFIFREPKATQSGCPFFGAFLWHKRKTLAHLLNNDYEVMEDLVCETQFNKNCQAIPKLTQ
jgi:hypothetical protein